MRLGHIDSLIFLFFLKGNIRHLSASALDEVLLNTGS